MLGAWGTHKGNENFLLDCGWKLERKRPLGRPCIDEKIILKRHLQKQAEKARTVLIGLRLRRSCRRFL
jgi:hypothetical protein